MPLSSNNLGVDNSTASSAFKVYNDVKAGASGLCEETCPGSSAGENHASAADVAHVCRGANDVRNDYANVFASDDRCLAGDARSFAADVTNGETTACEPLKNLAGRSGVTDSDEVINVCDVGTPSR